MSKDSIDNSASSQQPSGLDGLVRHVQPVAKLEHLHLPESALTQLKDVCSQAKNRGRATGREHTSGKGLFIFFSGPNGTGKTMAAEAIANELNLKLYSVDLSAVVSKYIGETEKNLRKLFGAAESADAVLYFDEADALFGKRSEVRDSHDRYANMEINYLLRRMEEYDGLAVLSSNMHDAIDPAFLRRLHCIVEFPLPDANDRANLWRNELPQRAPEENPEKFKP